MSLIPSGLSQLRAPSADNTEYQTRAVIPKARSQGPTLTHVFRRRTYTVLCGRVHVTNLEERGVIDTNAVPTCPVCRKRDPRRKPRAVLPSQKAAKRLRKDTARELPKLHRMELRLAAAWSRAVLFENLSAHVDLNALDRALAQLTQAIIGLTEIAREKLP